jgi:general stress protein 26
MPERKQVVALMNEADAVMLATIGAKGPRLRALVNLRRADRYPGPSRTARSEDFTVHLSTSRASDKLREVAANPAVALYYYDAGSFHGVMLAGKAEVVDDPELKKALWCDGWRVYWPDGAGNPDYVVLKIKAEEIRGWWGREPFQIEVT